MFSVMKDMLGVFHMLALFLPLPEPGEDLSQRLTVRTWYGLVLRSKAHGSVGSKTRLDLQDFSPSWESVLSLGQISQSTILSVPTSGGLPQLLLGGERVPSLTLNVPIPADFMVMVCPVISVL